MCDYSLKNVSSRPARIGDKLTTRDFGTGTRGFAAPEAANLAVCVLPGTEIAFSGGIDIGQWHFLSWRRKPVVHRTAIFRQVNVSVPSAHHDALEFPDGRIVLLTRLPIGKVATVLQLPAQPRNVVETQAQQRAAYAG